MENKNHTFKNISFKQKNYTSPISSTTTIQPTIISTDGNYAPFTYFVDSIYGNDTQGQENVPSKPFKTIKAAIINYQSLNTTSQQQMDANVIIRTGIYYETNLSIHRMHLYFEGFSTIYNNGETALFNDSSTQPINGSVHGSANFQCQPINNITSGPLCLFINPRTEFYLQCRSIYSSLVSAIIINDSSVITFHIDQDLYTNGSSIQCMKVVTKECNGFIHSIRGNNQGILFAFLQSNIFINTIQCLNATFQFLDYDVAGGNNYFDSTLNNRSTIQLIKTNTVQVQSISIQILHSDIYWKNVKTLLSENLFIASPLNGCSEPSLKWESDSIFTTLTNSTIRFSWNHGNLSFIIRNRFDMSNNANYNGQQSLVSSTGYFMIDGSMYDSTTTISNPSINIFIHQCICNIIYIGYSYGSSTSTLQPTHSVGFLKVHIDQAQLNQFFTSTLESSTSTLNRFLPKIFLSGQLWNTVGTIIAQSGGMITMKIDQIHSTVNNGGIIIIQDYNGNGFSNTSTNSSGVILWKGGLIQNDSNQIPQQGQITCCIYIPTQTYQIIQFQNTILSLHIPSTSSQLVDNSYRFIDPIYPIESCFNAPILNITSYKRIPDKLPGESISTPLHWLGTNIVNLNVTTV